MVMKADSPSAVNTLSLTCYIQLVFSCPALVITWGHVNTDALLKHPPWEHIRTPSTIWPLGWCKRFVMRREGECSAAFGKISGLCSTFSIFFNLVWFGLCGCQLKRKMQSEDTDVKPHMNQTSRLCSVSYCFVCFLFLILNPLLWFQPRCWMDIMVPKAFIPMNFLLWG